MKWSPNAGDSDFVEDFFAVEVFSGLFSGLFLGVNLFDCRPWLEGALLNVLELFIFFCAFIFFLTCFLQAFPRIVQGIVVQVVFFRNQNIFLMYNSINCVKAYQISCWFFFASIFLFTRLKGLAVEMYRMKRLWAGLYDQRFYWSNWVIESDDILQSWSTLKLLSNDGSLINEKLIV